jgi:hypothetical protein
MTCIKQRILTVNDYLFVFILIIYGGSATVFVRSIETWENVLGLGFILAFSLYYFVIKGVQISKEFIYLVTGFVLYFLASTIKFSEIHPRFFGLYIIYFYITFVIVNVLKIRFFIIYETILYYLCIIALIFWGIQQVIPEAFENIIKSIAFSKPGADGVESNIIFYTVNNVVSYNFNIFGIPLKRNPGFAWEPGAFAVLINLAMFINLVTNKFVLKGNKRFWLFAIALITTFSTTGYSIFALLIVLYIYNQKLEYMLWFTPVAIIGGIYLFSLPLMADKIIDLSQEDTNELVANSILYDSSYTPQRLTSFLIDWQDFISNPILGYGGHVEERWTAKLGADIASISGIGKIFARFGLIGAVFFFLLLFRSSKRMTSLFRFKGWIFPFLLIIMISISYSLVEHPLLMCFWMMTIFMPKGKTILIRKRDAHKKIELFNG